jgi:hypothetical protein
MKSVKLIGVAAQLDCLIPDFAINHCTSPSSRGWVKNYRWLQTVVCNLKTFFLMISALKAKQFD